MTQDANQEPVLSIEPYRYGGYILTDLATDRTVYVQTDWEYPGVASSFGWSIRDDGDGDCDHNGTDGTVDCPSCGRTVIAFINSAAEYLDSEPVAYDDPGYFDNEGNRHAS
jgi:hypothetical protein